MSSRVWEVDALRGLAIVLMVVYHFLFDLDYLGLASFSLYSGVWLVLQRVTLSLFLLLAGVSIHLSYLKLKERKASHVGIVVHFVKRSLFLFAVALFITLATWLFAPNSAVVFGVIHLIALSTLLAIPFLRFPKAAGILGAILAIASLFYSLPLVNHPWLLWLGFMFPGFKSFDFVPLFPWFGIVLVGLYVGSCFYSRLGSRVLSVPNKFAFLQFLGRNSLRIYLAHQPILFGLIYLFLPFAPK